VIVLYMNIRPKPEYNSYPPRDTIPADILTKYRYCSELEYTDRCVAFFTATFVLLKQRLLAISQQQPSREGVVKSWSSHMTKMESQSRADFFEELEQQYNKVRGHL
jgi:hypothetical protein